MFSMMETLNTLIVEMQILDDYFFKKGSSSKFCRLTSRPHLTTICHVSFSECVDSAVQLSLDPLRSIESYVLNIFFLQRCLVSHVQQPTNLTTNLQCSTLTYKTNLTTVCTAFKRSNHSEGVADSQQEFGEACGVVNMLKWPVSVYCINAHS